jgi:hypothetical protein
MNFQCEDKVRIRIRMDGPDPDLPCGNILNQDLDLTYVRVHWTNK